MCRATRNFRRRRSLADVQSLIQRFRRPDACRNALDNVRAYWSRCLGTVKVETPDSAVNFMANGWLLYQTLSCRIWARTGFYQSGGAYGFREQGSRSSMHRREKSHSRIDSDMMEGGKDASLRIRAHPTDGVGQVVTILTAATAMSCLLGMVFRAGSGICPLGTASARGTQPRGAASPGRARL